MNTPEDQDKQVYEGGMFVYQALREQLTLIIQMNPTVCYEAGLSGLLAVASDYIALLGNDEHREDALEEFCEKIRIRTEGAVEQKRTNGGQFLDETSNQFTFH